MFESELDESSVVCPRSIFSMILNRFLIRVFRAFDIFWFRISLRIPKKSVGLISRACMSAGSHELERMNSMRLKALISWREIFWFLAISSVAVMSSFESRASFVILLAGLSGDSRESTLGRACFRLFCFWGVFGILLASSSDESLGICALAGSTGVLLFSDDCGMIGGSWGSGEGVFSLMISVSVAGGGELSFGLEGVTVPVV